MPTYRAAGVSLRLSTTETVESLSSTPLGGLGSDVTKEKERCELAVAAGQAWTEGCDVDSGDLDFLGDAPFYCVPMNIASLGIDGAPATERTSDRTSSAPKISKDALITRTKRKRIDQSLNETSSSPVAPCPKALTISIQLDSDLSFCREKESRKKSDIKIDVFFNGEFADSSFVPKGRNLPHVKFLFSGKRIDRIVEAAWLVFPRCFGATEENRSLPGDSELIERAQRWRAIGESILREANACGFDTAGHRPPSAEFLEQLSRLKMPTMLEHVKTCENLQFGVIDIVISLGEGKKCPVADGYLRRPQRMEDVHFSVDNEPNESVNYDYSNAYLPSGTSSFRYREPQASLRTSFGSLSSPALRPATLRPTARTKASTGRPRGRPRMQNRTGVTQNAHEPVKRPEDLPNGTSKNEVSLRSQLEQNPKNAEKQAVKKKRVVSNEAAERLTPVAKLLSKEAIAVQRLKDDFISSLPLSKVELRGRRVLHATLHRLARRPTQVQSAGSPGLARLPESAFAPLPMQHDPIFHPAPLVIPPENSAQTSNPASLSSLIKGSILKIKMKLPWKAEQPEVGSSPRLKVKLPTSSLPKNVQPPPSANPIFSNHSGIQEASNSLQPSSRANAATLGPQEKPGLASQPTSTAATFATPAPKPKLTLRYNGSGGLLAPKSESGAPLPRSAEPLSASSDQGPAPSLKIRFNTSQPNEQARARDGVKNERAKPKLAASSTLAKPAYEAPAFDIPELNRNCLITYASRTDDILDALDHGSANRNGGEASRMDVDGKAYQGAADGFYGGGAYRQIRSERMGRFKESEVLLAVRYVVGLW